MAQFRLSETDRRFLQSLHICPDTEVRDIYPEYEPRPDIITISAILARNIIEKYGELNWQTFVAYNGLDKQDGETNG